MMNYQEYVSTTPIQLFFALIIFIYFAFRGLHLLNNKLVNSVGNRQKLNRVLYFVEFFAWIIFILEAIKYFAASNKVMAFALSIVIFVITAWISWFVIKDYIAGLYIRWNKLFAINDEIEIDNKKGKIVEFSSRFIVVEIDPLHTMQVVYSKLFNSNIVKVGLSGLSSNLSFTISLPATQKPVENLENIKTYIYQLPWINSKHEPMVIIEQQNKNDYLIRINVSLIDVKYSEDFKNSIRNKFNSNEI